MRFIASSSAPNTIQFSPSVLGKAISLPRLLDENEDGNEDEQLCDTTSKGCPFVKEKGTDLKDTYPEV